MQKQQGKGSIIPTEDMISLIGFQDQLLNVIHAELYARQVMEEDDIVRFQVHFLTDVNDAWRRMTEHLLFSLVRQRMPYDNSLRDYFLKLINVDFLPFIRLNKHELTQISLFGFDIYVEPLSAILQILNRMDGQRHILIKKIVENQQTVSQSIKQRDIWQGVKKGWDEFIYESSLYKLSLNVYMLKEYLKVAAKSLVKKDKQIVFTGCCNIFSEIVPILKRNRQIWLLCELGELNNQLYQFHPSFNYSHFYSLLLPLRNQFQPIFRSIRSIGSKCLNANLLTPLLFALLRSREAFHLFIKNVDDYCWVPYLNGLVFGLVYNFKARILQYQEALFILQTAIQKLGLLGELDARQFVGQLGNEWSEARDFFISALKVGYNIGELQTWHPVDSQTIQSRIIACTRKSLLMHPSLPEQTPTNVYFPDGFEHELEECLVQLTGSLVNRNQLMNSYSPNTMEAITVNQSKLQFILKLNNLLQICQLQNNTNCICYILSFLNKIYDVNSSVVISRLTRIGDYFCQIAIKQLEKDHKGKEDLKQVLFAYIKKNRPVDKIDEIIRVCLMISSPKQAISQILSIAAQIGPNTCDLVSAHIISAYCPQQLGPLTKVKTFDKEYSIERDIININSQLYLTFSVLIDHVIQNNSGQAVDVLVWMVRLANWTVVPLLSFPVSWRYDAKHNKKLQSFSTYLVSNPQHHCILYELLEVGLNIDNKNIKTYFTQICINTVCDQVIIEVNSTLDQLCQLEDNMRYRYILDLLFLLVKIYQPPNNSESSQIVRKVLKLYLRAVEKLDNVLVNVEDDSIVKQIADSLVDIYCPLLDLIYVKHDSVRKWRTCMRKVCLNSLDITIQHLHNARDFELPLIRKDKGFLIHNSVEDIGSTPLLSIQKVKQRVESLKTQAQKYNRKDNISSNKQKYLNQAYLIPGEEVTRLRFQEFDVSEYTKQNLLPPLSSKLIKLLYTHADFMDKLLTQLLSMTPSNHHRLIQYGLATKNASLITQIGLSRQSVQRLLPQIIGLLSSDQLETITSGLDTSSKKNISDNYNFMLMKQQQNCNDVTKISELIIDLSTSLGFLLVFNQSNWRYANQVINDLATTKMSGLSNTPSLLLQYTQYIKITYQPNSDYESKISQYFKLIQAYQGLLKQKYEYLLSLESPSMKQLSSGKSLKQSFLREQAISAQEIKLFKINELAYIQSFIEAWNVKDFLSRAGDLIRQLPNLAKDLTQFTQITQLIDSVVSSFMNVNKIVNLLAGGNIMCPDFLFSYVFCSDRAYHTAKITLGENLEAYYKVAQKQSRVQYCFLPNTKACPIIPYLQKHLPTIGGPLPIPDNMNAHVVNKADVSGKKYILEKYTDLQKYLSGNKMISTKEKQLIIRGEVDQNLKNSLHLYYFGVLYRALELTDQKPSQLDIMTECLRRREALNWQNLKNVDLQAYHHIKAVLVDQEVEKRKYLFVYKESPLIPQGASLQVNKLNREKYCNLVGKTSLGENLLSNLNYFLQGVCSVTSA